jgi:hypothetical protein
MKGKSQDYQDTELRIKYEGRRKIPPGAWMIVLRTVSKKKGNMQDKQDKETCGWSTEYKRIQKIIMSAYIFFKFACVLFLQTLT